MKLEITPVNVDPNLAPVLSAQLARLDTAIEKEFTLVSDRMTWMIVSEAFIAGAFATAVNSATPENRLARLVAALVIGLPILGILIAIFAQIAIQAAHGAAEGFKRARAPLEKLFRDELYVELSSHDSLHHAQGNFASRYLPKTICVSWFLLLIVALLDLWTPLGTAPAIVIGVLFTGCVQFAWISLLVRRSYVRRIDQLEATLAALQASQQKSSVS